MVQDLATQWLQSYPCKTKTSQETHKSLVKFLEPTRKPKCHLHWQFLRFGQTLWRIILESFIVQTWSRTRRITEQGNLCCCVKQAAAATHSLTCGVPDRERHEIRYLKQATELIEEWQNQPQGVPPVSRPSSEHGDVVLIEPAKSKRETLSHHVSWEFL